MLTNATFSYNLKHAPGLAQEFRECLKQAQSTLNLTQPAQRCIDGAIEEIIEAIDDEGPENFKRLLDNLYTGYSSNAIPKTKKPEGWEGVQRACYLYYRNANVRYRKN